MAAFGENLLKHTVLTLQSGQPPRSAPTGAGPTHGAAAGAAGARCMRTLHVPQCWNVTPVRVYLLPEILAK